MPVLKNVLIVLGVSSFFILDITLVCLIIIMMSFIIPDDRKEKR